MFNTFDDLTHSDNSGNNTKITPYWTVAKKSQEEKFRWLKDAFVELVERNEAKIRLINSNYLFYKGEVLAGDRAYREDDVDEITDRAHDTKLYVNYIKKLLEEQVNRLLELKPNIDVMPVHNENEDKVGAKAAKYLLDTVWYEENIDKVLRRVTNTAKIAGEHYVGVFWDEEKGEIDPDYKEAQKKTKGRIPVLDEDGNEVEDLYVDTILTQGDIKYEHIDARKILLEPVESGEWDDVNWVMVFRAEYCDKVKKRFPSKQDMVKKFSPVDAGINFFTQDEIDRLNREGRTLVITLYHRPTYDLPEGAEVTFTVDGILDDCKHKYNHRKLPIIRRTDIDTPGELRAASFIEDVKGLQIQYFTLTSGILANQRLFAYPKWFVPFGSVSKQALATGRGILQYKGQRAPTVYSPSPTPREIFETRDGFREEMRFIGTGSENTPGTPPPGITAGVALQFLNEQDLKRYNTDVAKHFEFIKEMALMTLSVCGQYYGEDHERLNKLVGKNNEHSIREFKNVDLNRPYDIRVAQSSGLPDTKAARVQTIIDLASQFEGLFTREQLLDALELGDANKLFDQSTAAVRSAESIVEDILQGLSVSEPQPYENLLIQWKVIITQMQQRYFKETVPVDRRDALIEYLMAMEMLMMEKAEVNPKFAMELEQLSLFPAVFVLPPPPPPPPLPGEIVEGDPRGEALVEPSELDGSGAADPGEELLINTRSDMGDVR